MRKINFTDGGGEPLSAQNLNDLQDYIETAINNAWSGAYPVGSIYITVDANANPNTMFSGSTWVRFAEGRTLVGMGSNGTTNYTTVEATGGEETHTLTISEMPSHTHAQDPHGHRARYNNNTASGSATDGGNSTGSKWKAAGTWIENTTATNKNTGGDGAHNNMQPYITVYMWKRTA